MIALDAGPLVDLGALERAIQRPVRFAPHDAPFWNDPHIAEGMLAAHIDPTTDAATRRPATVQSTVDHLVRVFNLSSGDTLLDLGCGPGLYAVRFAERGVAVTGIDLSSGSIAYARAAALEAAVTIDFLVGDYCRDPLGGPFDAAVLIYLDFGVLDDASRDRLLDALRPAIRPGGWFAFDVHGPARDRPPDGAVSASYQPGGFWRPGPHLVIETTHRYDDVDLTQYAIVEPDGSVTAYRVWDRAYSVPELRRLLRRHGFAVEDAWSDMTGTPLRADAPTLGILARRNRWRRRQR